MLFWTLLALQAGRLGGAARDGLLSLDTLSEHLNGYNHEGCNRPGIWLSALAATAGLIRGSARRGTGFNVLRRRWTSSSKLKPRLLPQKLA